jgi:hypothetical protein
LVIPGGGLNSTDAGLKTHPFNPFDEFANEFRVIAADLRNAKGRPVDWAAGDRPSVGRLLWTHRRREWIRTCMGLLLSSSDFGL